LVLLHATLDTVGTLSKGDLTSQSTQVRRDQEEEAKTASYLTSLYPTKDNGERDFHRMAGFFCQKKGKEDRRISIAHGIFPPPKRWDAWSFLVLGKEAESGLLQNVSGTRR